MTYFREQLAYYGGGDYYNNRRGCGCGISIGSIVAMIISASTHNSFIWILIHGFLGWFYVIYYCIVRLSDWIF